MQESGKQKTARKKNVILRNEITRNLEPGSGSTPRFFILRIQNDSRDSRQRSGVSLQERPLVAFLIRRLAERDLVFRDPEIKIKPRPLILLF